MSNKIIRTRYAPSPTGLFHIGGARTALFNYLFAKVNNGIFIVRIEDTDIERNVENGTESQLNNLKWLKIFPDESPINPGMYGPYVQSEKLDRYKALANQLLESKKAYRCFCTPEELNKHREECKEKGLPPKYNKKCLHLTEEEIQKKLEQGIPYSIRLNLTENKTYAWNDLIRGEISFNTDSMTDPVILKSNGIAMYNFAVVIDDHDMEITHVLRGEEHISNTPYQLAIKEALGFQNDDIQYGHLSIIVDETGKKLSKRNLELKQFIEDYRNMGFPESAITNFLCLLGWSRPDNKEIFSLLEATKDFDIKHVSPSPTFFDFNKMLWVSSQHIKAMDDKKYLSFVDEFVSCAIPRFLEMRTECLLLFKNQISYAKELDGLITELLEEKPITRKEIVESGLFTSKELIKVIDKFSRDLNKLDQWEPDAIQEVIKSNQKDSPLKGKDFFMPIRFASTFKTHGPELFRTIYILGKKRSLENLNSVLSEIKRWEYEG